MKRYILISISKFTSATGETVARKKTSSTKTVVKDQISGRLRQIRMELFGEHGGPELARRLDLPARTWYNYETGVTVPAEVMLDFLNQTSVNPVWLLTGQGNAYRESPQNSARSMSDAAPIQMIRRALELLETEKTKNHKPAGESARTENDSQVLQNTLLLPLIDIAECPNFDTTRWAQREGFPVAKSWITKPDSSVCVIVPNNAMAPVVAKSGVILVDLSAKDPTRLNKNLVIALDNRNEPVIRWFELSGESLILRPEQNARHYPVIAYNVKEAAGRILGLVLASFARFPG